MQRLFLLTLSTLPLMASLAGCGSSEIDERGLRVGVSGQVTLDGLPLSNARIVFITDEGEGTVKSTGLIEDGTYAIDASKGPLASTARVEIYPELMELEAVEAARNGDRHKKVEIKPVSIPVRYNIRTELTAQLSPDNENAFNYELTSR